MTLLVLSALPIACSLTSLDRYFECPPDHADCKHPATGSGGSGGMGAGSGGAPINGGAGSTAGGPVDSDAGMGGTAGIATDGGTGADAGSAGMRGSVAPGGDCALDGDCAHGTCFRNVCGDPLEVIYLDTPDKGSMANAAKWIKFQVQISNRSALSYPLSSLKIRYYYSPEDVVSEFQVLTTSAPPTADSDVLGSFSLTQTTPSLTYLELAFDAKAGTLAAGHTSGIVKVGVHDKDFGPGTFTELGDYSYLTPSHITLYLDGALVSGVEPR